MNIVIISALGNDTANRCVQSLLNTTADEKFNLFLVREQGFREQTLNTALEIAGTGEDILFVGDDIVFTPGWYEALTAHYEDADILGMSMLYPDSLKVQDRGYDLVQLNGTVTIEAADRGRAVAELSNFGIRSCDSLCGCYMFVKSHVLKQVREFSLDGQNRFGEFIFMCQARRAGAKIAVIDHFLYHGGVSTKSNPDKKLSSISYAVEKEIWENVVGQFVDQDWVKNKIQPVVSESLRQIFERTSGRVLIYGIGTVTEFLGKAFDLSSERYEFCTGLTEEVGLKVLGKKVKSVKDVNFNEFSFVLITPLFIGEKLFESMIKPRLAENHDLNIFTVATEKQPGKVIYDSTKIH